MVILSGDCNKKVLTPVISVKEMLKKHFGAILSFKIFAKISDDKIPLVLTFQPFNYKVSDVIRRDF